MRVYVIGLRNSYSIGEEPYITQPYPHADFIKELTERYELMEDELGVSFRRKDEDTKIEDVTENFLLSQPTGKKTYINSRSCSRYYLYYIPYEILDIDQESVASHNPQVYNLGWMIEERELPKQNDTMVSSAHNAFVSSEPIIIHTDPLTTTLHINTLGSGRPQAKSMFALKDIHDITGERMIYTYPGKWYRIRKCLMSAHL